MQASEEYPQQPLDAPATKRANRRAVASLALGIIACASIPVPFICFGALPIAIVGLVLGIRGAISDCATKHTSLWLPAAGIVVSGVALAIISIAAAITCGSYGRDTRWQEYAKKRYEPHREIPLHIGTLPHFTLAIDRHRGLYGGYLGDPNVYLIDVDTADVLIAMDSHVDDVYPVSVQCTAFSSDGKRAVSAGGGYADPDVRDRGKRIRFVCFWDLVAGTRIGLGKGEGALIRSVAYSPIDDKAVTGDDGGNILLWDLKKVQIVKRFVGHSLGSGIRRGCLVWSQDGRALLSGSWDGSVRLWDVESAKETAHLNPGYGRVNSLALSSDGKYALSSYISGPNQPVILWDLQAQQEINRFGIPGNPWRARQSLSIESVAFSPDGKTALFGLSFGTVIWWDIEQWRLIAMNRLHLDELSFVAFSADGKSSISVGMDKEPIEERVKIKFWRLPDRDTIKQQE